jgi:hypothetical protein
MRIMISVDTSIDVIIMETIGLQMSLSISHHQTILSFQLYLYHKPTAYFIMTFHLQFAICKFFGTLLTVNWLFHFIKPTFLYFRQLEVFLFYCVDKLFAFEVLLKRFKLQLKAQIRTNNRPFRLSMSQRLDKRHIVVLDQISNNEGR